MRWQNRATVWMLVAASMVGFLCSGSLWAAAPEVTILTWNHFVPGFNEEFVRQV